MTIDLKSNSQIRWELLPHKERYDLANNLDYNGNYNCRVISQCDFTEINATMKKRIISYFRNNKINLDVKDMLEKCSITACNNIATHVCGIRQYYCNNHSQSCCVDLQINPNKNTIEWY